MSQAQFSALGTKRQVSFPALSPRAKGESLGLRHREKSDHKRHQSTAGGLHTQGTSHRVMKRVHENTKGEQRRVRNNTDTLLGCSSGKNFRDIHIEYTISEDASTEQKACRLLALAGSCSWRDWIKNIPCTPAQSYNTSLGDPTPSEFLDTGNTLKIGSQYAALTDMEERINRDQEAKSQSDQKKNMPAAPEPQELQSLVQAPYGSPAQSPKSQQIILNQLRESHRPLPGEWQSTLNAEQRAGIVWHLYKAYRSTKLEQPDQQVLQMAFYSENERFLTASTRDEYIHSPHMILDRLKDLGKN